MNSKQLPAEEMTLSQLLAQVSRISGQRLRVHMEEIGLHRGQGLALLHLWRKDGMSQRDLARSMHISPASVTNMLQRMERDGWIDRKRDEADQRVVRVHLTAKANDTRKQARRVFQGMEDVLNSIYTDEEQATLRQLLTRLYEHLAPGDPHLCYIQQFLHDKDAEREPADAETRRKMSVDTENGEGASA